MTPQMTLVRDPWRQTYETHITTYEHLLLMDTVYVTMFPRAPTVNEHRVCDHVLGPNTGRTPPNGVETLSPGGEDS